MRILLDECAPRPLKRELADYEVCTVVEMGWSGKKNGELLRLMSQEGFTILLTTDQNLRYQQNLQQAGVAVIVLVATSNKLSDLLPLMPDACSVLDKVAPGEVIDTGKVGKPISNTRRITQAWLWWEPSYSKRISPWASI